MALCLRRRINIYFDSSSQTQQINFSLHPVCFLVVLVCLDDILSFYSVFPDLLDRLCDLFPVLHVFMIL